MRYLRSRDGFLELEITDNPGPDAFVEVADRICAGLDGRVVEKLDALAECYWDLEIDGRVVTLHFHAFIGTRIYANDTGSEYVIRRVGEYLGLDDAPL